MVVTLNHKKYHCPICPEELTVRHHQRMIAEWDMTKPVEDRNYFKLFGILTDSDYKSFHETTENEARIWKAIRWVIESSLNFGEQMPKVLKVGSKIIDLPTEVQDLSIGQNIHLKQELDKSVRIVDAENKDKVIEFSNYSMAVAIYLQPLIDRKKFDFNRAKEIEKEILEMPAYLIRPIGFFIVTNVLQYGRSPMSNWLRTLTNHIRTRKRLWLNWLSGNALHLMRTLV